jgi:hypothetical protein
VIVVTPTMLTIPACDAALVVATECAEDDVNRALEWRRFHRAYTRYQHLKRLRAELAARRIRVTPAG